VYYYNHHRPHQSLDGKTPADEVLKLDSALRQIYSSTSIRLTAYRSEYLWDLSVVDQYLLSMSKSLYKRLGGEDAIAAVVDEFYDRIMSDEQVAGYFQ